MQFVPGPVGRIRKLSAVITSSALAGSLLLASANLSICLSLVFPLAASAQDKPGGAGTAQQAVGMYNLGLAAYKQGSLESAIIFFRRATDMDPNLADAQYNLGVLYQSQRRLKEAIPRFQEVLRVKSADPDAHYQLGIALMDMGRAAEAKNHLSAIAPVSPHFADAQKRIQTCEAQLAGATMATPSYNPALVTQPATFNNATNQAMNLTPVAAEPPVINREYNTDSGNTLSHVVQPQNQPVQQVQQVQQIQQVQQVQQTVKPVAVAQRPSTPRPGGNAPVAVLANSSARVIATGFSAPSGLTFDRLGNLYVANFTSNTVDRISADGTRMQFSSGSNLKGPIGLAADDGGNIYVANYDGGTVARISPAGVSTIIGTGFKQPYYLTLDKEGNLFVSQQTDNSVVRLTLPRPVARTP